MKNNNNVEVKIDQSVLDKMGGKVVITLDENGNPCFAPTKDESGRYAKNSKFYGNIMSDGYVFNPYLHRRWLPMQYINMLRRSEDDYYNVNPIIENFGLKYSIKVVKDEVERLAQLEKTDKETFKERSKFFTLKDCVAIIEDYLKQLRDYYSNLPYRPDLLCGQKKDVIRCRINGKMTHVFVKTETDNINETDTRVVIVEKKKYVAEELVKEIDIDLRNLYYYNNSSYESLNYFLQRIKLSNYKGKVSKRFIECYKKSGAYYTLVELIIFNHCKLKNFKMATEAKKYLEECLNDGYEAYQFHAMLKECIWENRFKFENIFNGKVSMN